MQSEILSHKPYVPETQDQDDAYKVPGFISFTIDVAYAYDALE